MPNEAASQTLPSDSSAGSNKSWDMEETPLLVGLDGKSPLLVTAAACIPGANLPSDKFPSANHSDDQQLLLGGQHTWGVFSVESGSWVPTASELVSIHDVAFSPDGTRLLFAGGTPSQSGVVEQWDWNTRTRQAKVVAHDDVVYSVAWSPAGDYWCTASADQRCKVYRMDQHKVGEFVEHSKAVLDAQFLNTDAGELQIVSAGVDTTIQVWNALDGQRIRTLENHTHSVQQIVLLPRGASALERLIPSGKTRRCDYGNPR